MVLLIAGVAWAWGTLLRGQLARVLQELLGSIASEKDANTLDEGQQDAPHHCRAHHGQWATWRKEGVGEVESGENRQSRVEGLGPRVGALTAGSQHSPGQCSTGDGVPGIFLAPKPHQTAVDGGK